MHKLGRREGVRRYEVLDYYRTHEQPSLSEIAEHFGCTSQNIRLHVCRLVSEGLLAMDGNVSTVYITQAGQQWKSVKQKIEDRELLPCGHPKTSLPFCIPCRNNRRRQLWRGQIAERPAAVAAEPTP